MKNLALLLPLAAPLSAAPQDVVLQLLGDAPSDDFGQATAVADFDGDGTLDLLVGAFDGAGFTSVAGYARTYTSGGMQLQQFIGPAGSGDFGWSVAPAPDLDDDGLPDVLIGDPEANDGPVSDAGRVSIFSSATGAELFTETGGTLARLGHRVALLGDVTGDGSADFASGAIAFGFTATPSLRVRSGAGAAPLYLLSGDEYAADDLTGPGDVTGDGRADLLYGNAAGDGFARLLNGPDGALVREHTIEQMDTLFGVSVAPAGDLDLDGTPDYAVGAVDYSPAGLDGVGAVFAFSGADGRELWRADGQSPDNYGWRLDGGRDVDLDGVPDVATATLQRGEVLSGVDGTRLFYHFGQFFSTTVASEVALVPDTNGDGTAELLLSGPSSSGFSSGPGKVEVIAPLAIDCDGTGVFDFLEITSGVALDCNNNFSPDSCDIAAGIETDCDVDGIPDSCEGDCNENGVFDPCDIAMGTSFDCDLDGIPDECGDDCNGNGLADSCEVAAGTAADCDGDGLLDECELAAGATDCDADGVPDICQATADPSLDCDGDLQLDACELAAGTEPDCNANGAPDSCDVAPGGGSVDFDANGVPDECEHMLVGAPGSISVATGGTHALTLVAGPDAFLKTYFVLGTLSGTAPGIPLAGFVLPLNPDPWFQFTAAHANENPPLQATTGVLGYGGSSVAPAIVVPLGLDAGFVGATFHHAFLVLDGIGVAAVSNAVELVLVP
ncbi:MAG: integrin alpha [Planctomycetota bacterium]